MIEAKVQIQEERKVSLQEKIRDRALGQNQFDFEPYSCYIEYKAVDVLSGVQFRDCVVDYTRCPNKRCIKKLT
ncbi:MAG: hypothetical protein JJT78_00315 [Leptospira sp.]|nr:hypothetical protein [Leptospira sp.]